ncbi:hypothetical protein WISP_39555 [Willisornis vidua]|uniref:Uncharacterized protein n=1 Tax=Willisornis vidua TaxID=1566151 RepID=A0ABQ9DHK8_9PASS|nr:hypothetical protein WISP_39555 [Willisornis vidua]
MFVFSLRGFQARWGFLERLECWDPRVTLDPTARGDPQAPQGNLDTEAALVPSGSLAGRAGRAPRVTLVSLENKECQALR